MPYCATCGVYCSENECEEDTRGSTDVIGTASFSRVELVHYCRPCAASNAKTTRLLMWVSGLFVAIVLAWASYETVGWFSRRKKG